MAADRRGIRMEKEKVLFVCVHNSARSQMAEAWLNVLHGEQFEAKSAGMEPGELNPLVVKAMEEAGIDISKNRTKSVSDILKSGDPFSFVITVCDETAAERCPAFPGFARPLHWSFPDPAVVDGSLEEKMDAIRKIRNDIRAAVEGWVSSHPR
jgi:arsenate reductase